ncbi:hypothetical protein PBI_STROKESEAT_71 [Mycobacterium phage Strokeseat]|uniref:Uncharacterized protein n=2 Tax=Cheoctovirus TaxID=1623281 RepID=A0A7G9V046_9CAUD|nr:hypothetical protein I5H14_gp075 [Mycobacterium phage Batiatus]YP_009958206.1 hypothetical protein I5H48_gp071 [Mycobacterium phage Hlubikazi]QGJ91182.1 hypothetical protein PBI_STROKESEAT_71 [Mycobacterium phage Strokeseat]QNN99101.1 hypothetical protein PBI_MANDLOVU_71 [Mycobacterium phage Mandlovu]AVP41759.1 hypothetical protein SEA_BATIATUS_75 [Mycobacterium phage Batiatus]QNN99651.1 hypothetical protein PBI_HLUBIKAZI_71 [Mycobacterium phage Hlubikazi]
MRDWRGATVHRTADSRSGGSGSSDTTEGLKTAQDRAQPQESTPGDDA